MNLNVHEMAAAFDEQGHNNQTGSILSLIYDHYAEFHGSSTPMSREYYKAIREQIASLVPAKQDALVDLVNLLCSAHENTAFIDGVKTGVRLLCELME